MVGDRNKVINLRIGHESTTRLNSYKKRGECRTGKGLSFASKDRVGKKDNRGPIEKKKFRKGMRVGGLMDNGPLITGYEFIGDMEGGGEIGE